MPTMAQLVVVCVVAVAIALVTVLLLHVLGLGSYAPVVAGIAASVASAVVMVQLRAAAKNEESGT